MLSVWKGSAARVGQELLTEIADRRLSEFLSSGESDLKKYFIEPFSVDVILEILGVDLITSAVRDVADGMLRTSGYLFTGLAQIPKLIKLQK